MKKIVIFAACFFMSLGADAMRCSNHIIDEGVNISDAITWCGQPTSRYNDSYNWNNFDGTNTTYTIHVDTFGVIDSIDQNMQF